MNGTANSLIEAINDLNQRSLSALTGDFSRLVYLASTRDYMTGVYSHDGLANRFRKDMAELALEYCHVQAFQRIVDLPLEEFTRVVESTLRSSDGHFSDVLSSWKELQPYLMLVPKDSEPVTRKYFFSNVRVALAVLTARLEPQGPEQSASPPL